MILLFIVQGLIYIFIENVLKILLAMRRMRDASTLELMPSWMPYILLSNLASLIGLSALRSFWYSANFFQSLKWISIFRGASWLGLELITGAYQLWVVWRLLVERKHTQQGLGQQSGWFDSVDSYFDRDGTFLDRDALDEI